MAYRDFQLQTDIDRIIHECTGVGDLLDELTLLRMALRAYLDGKPPADAVAWACAKLSDSITKRSTSC